MIKKSKKIMTLFLTALITLTPAAAFAEDSEIGDNKNTDLIESAEKSTLNEDKVSEVLSNDKEDDTDLKSSNNTTDKNVETIAVPVKEEEKTYNVGWVKNNNGSYNLYDGLGSLVKSSWCKVGGKWYYLKDDGTMATYWVQSEGNWYYVGQSGDMQKGWIKDGGLWYYLNDDGILQKGWLYSNGSWYFMNQYGAMVTDGVIDGYTLGSDGRCR